MAIILPRSLASSESPEWTSPSTQDKGKGRLRSLSKPSTRRSSSSSQRRASSISSNQTRLDQIWSTQHLTKRPRDILPRGRASASCRDPTPVASSRVPSSPRTPAPVPWSSVPSSPRTLVPTTPSKVPSSPSTPVPVAPPLVTLSPFVSSTRPSTTHQVEPSSPTSIQSPLSPYKRPQKRPRTDLSTAVQPTDKRTRVAPATPRPTHWSQSSLHQADRSQIPLYAVEFPNAAPSVYGSTISSAHTDTYTDADSEHRPSRSRSQSSADLDYADLRARIHQEEQAVQALMEQPDHRPARRATTNPPMAEVPVHRFGTPSRHWRPAEVAKLEELLGEFGTAWQAIWNDNYIGWTKGPKSDWIHPGRDAKKYRYKARNMKIQIMRSVPPNASIHIRSTNRPSSAQEDVPIYLADVNLSRAELNRVAQGRISHASARGPQSRRPLPQSTRRTGHYTRKFEQSLFRIPPSY